MRTEQNSTSTHFMPFMPEITHRSNNPPSYNSAKLPEVGFSTYCNSLPNNTAEVHTFNPSRHLQSRICSKKTHPEVRRDQRNATNSSSVRLFLHTSNGQSYTRLHRKLSLGSGLWVCKVTISVYVLKKW